MDTKVKNHVIKRNGEEVDFDLSKIVNAIKAANQGVDRLHQMNTYQIQAVADNIAGQIEDMTHAVNVEDIQDMVETRIREGENLRNDLIAKLEGMLAHVDFITERSPEIIEEYKEKLTKKVEELLSDKQVDESRLLMEVTIFADKVCVDEELVRLRSHITATRDALLAGGSIGRKLDFIAQEMNREANTILSKSSDLEISNRAIELKTEIEKVREQIQNIE